MDCNWIGNRNDRKYINRRKRITYVYQMLDPWQGDSEIRGLINFKREGIIEIAELRVCRVMESIVAVITCAWGWSSYI